MQDGFIVHHQATPSRITGMESQGYPTVHIVKHIQSPHASLEGVRLNVRRISSFICQAKRYPESPGQGVTRLPHRSRGQAYQSLHASS